METPELSEEETAVWESLVSKGREIRAPMLERRERERAAKRLAVSKEGHRSDPSGWKVKPKQGAKADEPPVPVGVKRFVVARAAGISFNQAAAACGCRWTDIQMARNASEEMRCALEGLEESSRFLMRTKAMSVLEQSQDEGVRVSHAQVLMAESILKRLDHSHFGDAVAKVVDGPVEETKAVGNGGFVINVISDATKVAGEAPKERPAKALVYTDV